LCPSNYGLAQAKRTMDLGSVGLQEIDLHPC